MTLVVRKVDERKLREFRAEAVRRGLTLSQAVEEAIELWLRTGSVKEDVDINNLAYLRLKRQLSKHHGKYVVIAGGRLVGVFNSIEEVANALKREKPKTGHAIVFRVGYDKRVRGAPEWWGGSIEARGA